MALNYWNLCKILKFCRVWMLNLISGESGTSIGVPWLQNNCLHVGLCFKVMQNLAQKKNSSPTPCCSHCKQLAQDHPSDCSLPVLFNDALFPNYSQNKVSGQRHSLVAKDKQNHIQKKEFISTALYNFLSNCLKNWNRYCMYLTHFW